MTVQETVFAQTDTIQVHGFTVSSDTHDLLLLYFENSRRSGGSEVISCDILADQKSALIRFKDREGESVIVNQLALWAQVIHTELGGTFYLDLLPV